MDSTLAKRQQEWRDRQEAQGKKQLVTMVSVEAHEAIERIRKTTGEKKAQVVERAILALEKPADLFSPVEPETTDLSRDQIIDLINKMRREGNSYQVIADQLNQKQIPTLSGKGKWHGKTVQKICKKQ